MTKRNGRWLRTSALLMGALVVAFLVWRAMQPTPVLVDTAAIERGVLRVTVDEDGRTRVRDRYLVSAPIPGQLQRPPLRPGDRLVAGETLLAEFTPAVSTPLDARSREEALARLARARASLQQAEAARNQLVADRDFTAAELDRFGHLVQDGIKSPDELDRVARDARRAEQGLRAGEFAVQVARFEVELAEATLWEPDGSGSGRADGSVALSADTGRLQLRSPVDGVVLQVFEENTRTLGAGTPILELADTSALEVEAEFLTQEAVLVEPGMTAAIVGWGGVDGGGREVPLAAVVRRVEPGGFTKVSALGVEEQRVRILLDPVRSPGAEHDPWQRLGDGFRVEVQIQLWEDPDALKVPIGALFRSGLALNPSREAGWSVYKVVDNRTIRQAVRMGRFGELEASVLEGLEAGDEVVLYPSELIAEGTLVAPR